jgi:cytochrome c oxidase cbb3-type subunit I
MNTATAATFNDKLVRQFSIMTVVWGIVGMLVGVGPRVRRPLALAAAAAPSAHQRGHFRPRRVGAVCHVVQRTCQVRLFPDVLASARTLAGSGLRTPTRQSRGRPKNSRA